MAAAAVETSRVGIDLPTYHQVPETTYDRMKSRSSCNFAGNECWQETVDWADLATLDLSTFDQPGGKEKLAKQLYEAIQTIGQSPSVNMKVLMKTNTRTGFFYIINFGLSQEAVDRQFAIGKEVFKLPTEEKLKYRADLEHGGYNGYKPLGIREIRPGIFDNTEIFNIPKFIPEYERPWPELIKGHWDEIETFAKTIHEDVVKKLLTLFAMVLELPEDYFLKHHR